MRFNANSVGDLSISVHFGGGEHFGDGMFSYVQINNAIVQSGGYEVNNLTIRFAHVDPNFNQQFESCGVGVCSDGSTDVAFGSAVEGYPMTYLIIDIDGHSWQTGAVVISTAGVTPPTVGNCTIVPKSNPNLAEAWLSANGGSGTYYFYVYDHNWNQIASASGGSSVHIGSMGRDANHVYFVHVECAGGSGTDYQQVDEG